MLNKWVTYGAIFLQYHKYHHSALTHSEAKVLMIKNELNSSYLISKKII